MCVPTEQRERLESSCPTHTLRTQTHQVSICAILPFVSVSSSTCFTSATFKCLAVIISVSVLQLMSSSASFPLCFFFSGVSPPPLTLVFVFIKPAHLLCETLVGPDPDSPSDTIGTNNNNHLQPCSNTSKTCEDTRESSLVKPPLAPPPSVTVSTKPSRLSLERSFSAEEDQQKCVECPLQPARVYTISSQRSALMSGGRGSKESLELDVLKEKSGSRGGGSRGGLIQPSTSPSSTSSSPTQCHHASSGRGTSHHHHGNHHHGNHHSVPSSSGTSGSSSQQQSVTTAGSHHASHHSHHHHLSQPPLQTSVSAHNIRSWGEGGKGEAECSGLACESCSGPPSRSQGSLDLESTSREAGKQHRRLERMWSVDRVTGLERGERGGHRGRERRRVPNQGGGVLMRPYAWDWWV